MRPRTSWGLASVAAVGLACSGTSGSPAPAPSPARATPAPAPGEPVEPTHAAVQTALASDVELSEWVSTPADYILRPALAETGLTAYRLWFVIPTDVPHPISVYVARNAAGETLLTTGRPQAVWAVLAADPRPPEGEALAVLVHELLRDQSRAQEVLPGTAVVKSEPMAWSLTFDVRDTAAGTARWTVQLDSIGSAVSTQPISPEN